MTAKPRILVTVTNDKEVVAKEVPVEPPAEPVVPMPKAPRPALWFIVEFLQSFMDSIFKPPRR